MNVHKQGIARDDFNVPHGLTNAKENDRCENTVSKMRRLKEQMDQAISCRYQQDYSYGNRFLGMPWERRVSSPPSPCRRYSPYVIPQTHCRHNPLPPLLPYPPPPPHQQQIQQQQPSSPLNTFPSQKSLFINPSVDSFQYPTSPLSYEFEGPYDNINPSIPPTAKYYKWSKPLGPFSTLNTDGSVAKRRSGIGGIIRNSDGVPLLAFADRCPEMPIYAVELWAIRRGLQLALSSGVKYLNVDTDSTDAVKWIFSLTSKCPLLVRKCISDIHVLLNCFVSWHVKHVYRETNSAADFLSKFAENAELILHPYHFPPQLQHIVDEDAKGHLYLRLKFSATNNCKNLTTQCGSSTSLPADSAIQAAPVITGQLQSPVSRVLLMPDYNVSAEAMNVRKQGIARDDFSVTHGFTNAEENDGCENACWKQFEQILSEI
ncbi:hypothetical protein AQUCO_00100397v1 [Aquilegia coerulea]|uniref:RNase H type-1 domain-containing protein n=1 Tax=Aquilegia coerulea TaxID=218851 RepID=A0A2G5FA66_AQUCA|nr:hypothetical protein AQUCO_00100397v1 [Aquilegia coerulea]